MSISWRALRVRVSATETSTSETPRRATLLPLGSLINRPDTVSQGVLIARATGGRIRVAEASRATRKSESSSERKVNLNEWNMANTPSCVSSQGHGPGGGLDIMALTRRSTARALRIKALKIVAAARRLNIVAHLLPQARSTDAYVSVRTQRSANRPGTQTICARMLCASHSV